ncbi:quinone oxidoreductase family protein [Thiopseudomonas denitrificans]|uniref:NADPH:quinone reductase-like Zn-dependent oxidoreductase n=1 Tax=Thiopseudomonas denitrificans TaxID=1501432 RepID=A0A4R6TU89_9GAMM|nr:zinc-binding alcohol dehydrogenase family protein [Thiopseudomonas denitrificans]TDQ34648.1 NADPH:quinone reductase-like Zn-dependent oxidoreductase [Thiopseudomonas denitrificans]
MSTMLAAVLHDYGQTPQPGQLPTPVAGEGQALLQVEAASIKQLDKLKAAGKHYTRYARFPVAVGVDGVGRLPDGQRVYAMGVTGMLAQQALVQLDDCVPVPEELPAALAALLPNALLGSDAALVCRAGFQPGEVVLVNGATGVSGRMAVQAARLRGASRIIVTGRNAESLGYLKELGADQCISLLDEPQGIIEQLVQIQQTTPINVVLDYLWGEPVQWLLAAFAKCCPHPVRLVTIGQMAGAEINLASGILRSTPVSILGSGLGSINAEQLRQYNREHLTAMLERAARGELVAGYREFALQDVAEAWQAVLGPGERAVVYME